MNAATLDQKLWNYCNVLLDDGMYYSDYVEQLTLAVPQNGGRALEAALQPEEPNSR